MGNMNQEIKNEMQTVFDKVANHLLTQNAKSIETLGLDDGGDAITVCRYRGDHGMMCAVGCLLTDKQASQNEGSTWTEILYENKKARDLFCNETHELIKYLQKVHDNRNVPLWKGELADLAKMHQLSSSVLEKF